MSLDYGTLKTRILAEGKRPWLTAEVEGWIRTAEAEIARRGRFAEMVQAVALDNSSQDATDKTIYYTPPGFLDARVLRRSNGQKMTRVNPNQVGEYRKSQRLAFYAVLNKRALQFNIAPGDTETFELLYFERPAQLSDNNPTNEILQNHEDIYVNLGLSELYKYTEDLEMAGAVASAAVSAIDELNKQAARSFGGVQNEEGPYNFNSIRAY